MCTVCGFRSIRRLFRSRLAQIPDNLAHRSDFKSPGAGKLDAVCVVNEPVQDGVGIGRIANDFVPSVDGTLGGDHRGAASVAFFEDFQKIMPGGSVEGFFDAMLTLPAERCQGRRKSPAPRSIALTILSVMC
jgi:hypothetical protein